LIDIRLGDCIEVMRGIPDGAARCCVTSPPYWGLRDYGADGQLGLEVNPDLYILNMRRVFREVHRVLSDDGTLWLNLGDTIKDKQLLGIPWRVALALQSDGWYLRSDIIWAKPNPMPESVRDRPTKSHEYIFLLAKNPRYFYDSEAIKEQSTCKGGGGNFGSVSMMAEAHRAGQQARRYDRPDYRETGRNARSVWTITPRPFKGAHFATFPPELAERCIKAGSSERGKCPECGAAWVRVVEREQGDNEANQRPKQTAGMSSSTSTLSLSGNGSKEWAERGGKVRTTGWRPTCDHGHEPVPDVVLDPFAGAGTVGLVCQRLGRNHIGAELNPAYRDMALARIKAESSPLLESVA
jgi:DNA modification methylase